jgi:CubicO group peptidase (beta-lactamase class C family)
MRKPEPLSVRIDVANPRTLALIAKWLPAPQRKGRTARPTLTILALLACCFSFHALASDQAITREGEASLNMLGRDSGPGATILIGQGDEVLFHSARGRAEIELDVPLSKDDVFRIGSNTKQFTAAAILKLVDQGRIAVTDPLSRFLPGYPNGEHITIEELLRHTSGIKDYLTIDGYAAGALRQDVSTEQLINVFKNLPADFPPGSDWEYSNSGYILLGAVIESVTKKPWHVVLHDLLLAPLTLHRTTYDDGGTLISRRAAGYSVDAAGRTINAPYISMTQAAAAGGLISSADDLFHWMRALHTGRVLRQDSYHYMTTVVQPPSGRSIDYACGISTLRVRGEPAFEHVGRDPGYMSETLYVPKPAISVVVLANTDSPRADISVIAAKLAAVAMGNPYPERHPVSLTPAQMDALAGIYDRGKSGHRTIAVRDGHLYTKRDGGSDHILLADSQGELYFDEVLDYFAVVRDRRGDVVALDEFVNGEQPPLRLPKQKEVNQKRSPSQRAR